MSLLEDIIGVLTKAITPSEAGAEMIPTTPFTKALLARGLQQPGPQGDIIRQAQARPEKTYVSDEPTFLQKWLGQGTLGNFTTSPLGTQNIQLNKPLIDFVSKQTGQDEAMRTLAHEGGHFVAQATGQGGNISPTGIPLLDYIIRSVIFPTGKDLRLPVAQNEALADKLAGLNQEGQ